MFVKGGVDWVDVTNCVESAVVGVFVCICHKSEGFDLGYLQFVFCMEGQGVERNCCIYEGWQNSCFVWFEFVVLA